MIPVLSYIKGRFVERSTWLAIGTGVAAASALPAPWSYIFVAIGVIGAVVPDGTVHGGVE